MRNGKLLFIIFLFCFTCATYGVKKGMDQRQSGSPASVRALRLIGVVGEKNLGTSSLYLPTGIAIDHLGNLFITDTGNDRVVKCDPEGNFLAETGGFGWEAGEFNRPTYIATDNDLNVYVVDAQNRRIQRFDQNLNFLSAIEAEPEDDFSGLGLLQGIAITPSGEIILSDMEGDYLIKLNSYLEYERTFGGFGEMETGLRDPEGISVSRDGKIFVADSQNHRIVVFDWFGNLLRSFGQKFLHEPKSVAVGKDQLVYVANTGKSNLVIFDLAGNLIRECGNSEWGTMDLSKPTDLKLGKENELLVVDSGNNRILVFEILR